MKPTLPRQFKYWFFICLVFPALAPVKAQYVTIPDANFVTWLNANGFASCLTGNQLDTTCGAVLSATTLNCNGIPVYDLTGVQYFKNVTSLDCSSDSINNIPALPPALVTFNCSSNFITSLPDMPANVQSLYCSSNQLNSLPNMPDNLSAIDCDSNYIFSINQLPYNLFSLSCQYNAMAYLPDSMPWFLNYLYCNNNQLVQLPAGPGFLYILDCSYNYLENLPALNYDLESITCSHNYLQSLPVLPIYLQILDCSWNDLDSFPAWPSTLGTLVCYGDNLDSLPALPPNLISLACSDNKLGTLPALPASLTVLTCANDSLTSLPSLPTALTWLLCDTNNLSSMPALPASLNFLSCQYNQLDSLPIFPAALQTLWCSYNNLQFLPALPDSLSQILCVHNNLDSLPPLPALLNQLYCDNNNLLTLPGLPETLTSLSCDSNDLYSLPALPGTLRQLYCDSNDLYSLPALPSYMLHLSCTANPHLTCLPMLTEIENLSFWSTAVTCLPNYGSVQSSAPPLSFYPLCGILNAGGCGSFWNISGKTFYNTNANCQLDSTDVEHDNIKVLLYSHDTLVQQTFTGDEGVYSFVANPGNYVVTADTSALSLGLVCPDTGYFNVLIGDSTNQVGDRNFTFNCRGSGYDLGVQSLLNSNIPRPAATFLLYAVAGDMSQLYGANCAAGISGQVQLVFSGQVSYAGVAPGALEPSSVTGNTITWDVADFGTVNINNAFNAYFRISEVAVVGSQVCFTMSVNPTAGDVNLSNNTLQYCLTVVDALDPNEKEVYPSGLANPGEWLTYTIRFQNTGTAPAVNILVADTLCPDVIPSTFKLLAYSAKNITQIFGNVVNFNFPEINLPDSATSDSLSRGYVQYKVQVRSNLSAGTIIKNTADIYFDLNSPVVTNTIENCVPLYDSTSATIACGDSLNFGGNFYTQTGSYNDTLTAASGCDSILTLQLSVLTGLNSTGIICPGDSFNFYDRWLYSAGYYDTLLPGACDTLVSLNLTSYSAAPTAIYDTICATDSILFNGIYYHTAGTDSAQLSNRNGCDSLVVLYLTTTTGFYDTLTPGICAGDTFYVGNTGYTLQGNYMDTLQSVAGCDSIVSLTLTVNPLPVVTFTWDSLDAAGDLYDSNNWCWHLNPDEFIAKGGNPPGGYYTWNGVLTDTITFDTMRVYVAPGLFTITYSYTDSNHCTANIQETINAYLSGCPTAINSVITNDAISLYPNPTTSLLYIKTEGLHPQTITIYDVNGQAVLTQPFTPVLDIHNLSAGVYLLEVNSVEGVARKRWVKSSE